MTKTLIGSLAVVAVGYGLFMSSFGPTLPGHLEDAMRWCVFAQTGFALAVTLGIVEIMARASTRRTRLMTGLRLTALFTVGADSFVMLTVYERIGLAHLTWAAPYGCIVFAIGDLGLWIVLQQLRRYCKQELTVTLVFNKENDAAKRTTSSS